MVVPTDVDPQLESGVGGCATSRELLNWSALGLLAHTVGMLPLRPSYCHEQNETTDVKGQG